MIGGQGGGLVNNNDAEANGGAIGANSGSTTGTNSGAGVDLGVNDVAMGDVLGGFVSLVRENDDKPQEEVEVPTLGAAKAGRGWIWWAMGMSGGALLFLALVWRRKRGDEVER